MISNTQKILPDHTNPEACHESHQFPKCDTTYEIEPTTLGLDPPIGRNALEHLITHPQEAEEKGNNLPCHNVWLRRLPKKKDTKLTVCPPLQIGIGWGVEIEEGWHMSWLMKMTMFAFLLIALVFLACWWKLRGNLQAATSMAALLVACASLILSAFAVAVAG